MKHTPGPWSCSYTGESGYGWDIYGDNIWIGTAHHSHSENARPTEGFPSNPEGKANARLIAAAPDLLEALVNIQIRVDGRDYDVDKICHDAIAKAKGETP